ncbi:MAG TPA: Gfo/Idh/MocA family oxidoreductase, partial [Arachnia sp.]|nr:Gfo/Idh/MocA family oxidoreductase [Arachnia sp.]
MNNVSPFSLGIVGAGQFSGQFAKLFKAHPLVSTVQVTDLLPERAADLNAQYDLDGTFDSFDDLLASDVDAVAIFTQRWTHAPLVLKALDAGKHVYSAVPMAISVEEIEQIIAKVTETGLIYMMGETSYYNPATVFARNKVADGAFGRIFYAEGDYVHDMDLGFYAAYQYSGGEDWKKTASYPPMLYPTHSIGGILGAWQTHATSVSAIGVSDDRGDGVFDREVSMFDNDFSNMTGLFEVAGGGSFRVNEFRRVGFPSFIRESRFRWFGTEATFEEMTTTAYRQDREGVTDVSEEIEPRKASEEELAKLADVSPTLRDAFLSGLAPVHDPSRLPA